MTMDACKKTKAVCVGVYVEKRRLLLD